MNAYCQYISIRGILKPNYSELLLSQCNTNFVVFSFVVIFNRGRSSVIAVTIDRSVAAENAQLSASGATCIL